MSAPEAEVKRTVTAVIGGTGLLGGMPLLEGVALR
jgi:hypothetical protein